MIPAGLLFIGLIMLAIGLSLLVDSKSAGVVYRDTTPVFNNRRKQPKSRDW